MPTKPTPKNRLGRNCSVETIPFSPNEEMLLSSEPPISQQSDIFDRYITSFNQIETQEKPISSNLNLNQEEEVTVIKDVFGDSPQGQLRKLRRTIDAKNTQLSQLREEVKYLKGQLTNHHSTQHKRDIQFLTQNNQELYEQTLKCKEQNTHLTHRVALLTSQMEAAITQVSTLRHKNSRLKQANQKLSKQIESYLQAGRQQCHLMSKMKSIIRSKSKSNSKMYPQQSTQYRQYSNTAKKSNQGSSKKDYKSQMLSKEIIADRIDRGDRGDRGLNFISRFI